MFFQLRDQQKIVSDLTTAFTKVGAVRVLITIMIVIWGICISYYHNNAPDLQTQKNVEYIHNIWFGSYSIFQTLFALWIFTILFAMLVVFLPSLKNIYSLVDHAKQIKKSFD